MASLSYIPLLNISLTHEYFADGKCTDFELVPSDDTVQIFNGMGVQWRFSGNELKTFIRTNGAADPFINDPEALPPSRVFRRMYGDTVFRFHLKIKNTVALNYTNLPFDLTRRFYASNRSGNTAGGRLYLTLPLTPYNAATAYAPGMLVTDGGGNVFEAVVQGTGAALNDPAAWEPRGAVQFATGEDSVFFTSGMYVFHLPAPVHTASISVLGFNYDAAAPAYSVRLGVQDTITYPVGEERQDIPIDLSQLPPALYKIGVNGNEEMVYLDPTLEAAGVFGTVEIYNHLPHGSPFAFLDANESVQVRNYTVHFAARRVLWKYIRKDNRALSVDDAGTSAHQFGLQGDAFISKRPIRLSQNALSTLELTVSGTSQKLAPLPNPPVHRLGRCTQDGFDYLCSEMYLNY